MKNRLVDVTKDFLAKSKPGVGLVILEEGLDINTHINEIETAYWLLNTFGGQITVLKEKNMYKIKTPDYEWDGKYWELKKPRSKKSVQKRFRKGMKQTLINQGGVIFDLTKSNITLNNLIGIINFGLGSYNALCGFIIVKDNNKLLAIYKKK